MRVLIINTNRERSPHTLVPLGACLVASAVRAAGHEVRFVDLTFDGSHRSVVAQAVRDFRPRVVGLSIRNIDNCDYLDPRSLLPEVAAVADECRRAGAQIIAVGGPAVTTSPGAILRYVGADYAVVGEGEVAMPGLLRAIETGSDPMCVSGIATVDGEWVVASPPESIHDLSALPDPTFPDWLDLGAYQRYDAAMPVQTKRGCPFRCAYCPYPAIEGEGIRLRDPESVAADVARARRLGFRSVEFVDSVFNAPESHAIDCCEAIARLPERLPLQTVEMNPSRCSDDLVRAMNAAGFSAVGCTAESGSDRMLRSLGKGFQVDDLYAAAARMRKLDALKLWIFMIGAPGEDESTVAETVKFLETALGPDDLAYISFGVRVLPGTDLFSRVVEEGAIPPDADLLQPTFYFSPHITPERSMEIISRGRFPSDNIVQLGDGNNKLLPIAQRIGHALGMEPPYWRYAPIWNRARHCFTPRLPSREGRTC